MATFDGNDLGIVEEVATAPAPCAFQKSAYPRLDGVERLRMGARGKVHRCRGVLAGVDASDLSNLKQTLGAYVLAGVAATLVDADGTSWASTVMTAFNPVGPRYILASSPQGVAQR